MPEFLTPENRSPKAFFDPLPSVEATVSKKALRWVLFVCVAAVVASFIAFIDWGRRDARRAVRQIWYEMGVSSVDQPNP